MALVSGRTWHARAALDEALVALAQLTDEEAPTREVAYHLQAALQRVYAALAARDDAAESAKLEDTAQKRARVALVLLEGWEADHPALDATRAVRDALAAWGVTPDRLAEVELKLPAPGKHQGPPTAAYREPLLLTRSRQVLQPAVILPESAPLPPAFPTFSLEETEIAPLPVHEEPTPVPTAPPPEVNPDAALYLLPLDRRAVERSRAQDLLEDLAMLGNMRRPSGPWRDAASPERRLLARVEGIVACGQSAWTQLADALSDRPVPDGDLLWAALFFFGSLDGDDARDQVLRLLRTAHLEEPDAWEAAADALLHAPHPGVRAALHKLLEGSAPEARLAVRVLGRRRELPVELLLRRFHGADDTALRHELAAVLATARGNLPPRELNPLLFSDDAVCVSHAFAALVQHRQAAQATRAARDFVREGRAEWGDAAMWLALTSGVDALADLKAALTAPEPGPVVMEAAGWFGSVELVEPLLALLRKKATASAAAQALQRITGASITDALPSPEYEKGQEPFTAGHQPQLPVVDLSAKTRTWTAWWKAHGKSAQPATRYRSGHPWTVADNLREMADLPISTPERSWAHAELVARLGLNLPLDVWEFVVRQQAQLEAWKPPLEKRARASTGTWIATGTG